MISEALQDDGLSLFAITGLVIFVATFVAITAWTLTRSRWQIDRWSSLPLNDSLDPTEARYTADQALPVVTAPVDKDHQESCGKCEDCICKPTTASTSPNH